MEERWPTPHIYEPGHASSGSRTTCRLTSSPSTWLCPRPPSTTGSRTCRWAASAASPRTTGREPCRRSTAGCARRPTSRARPSTTSSCGVPTFRDFVALYIAEGYKRNRNRVSIANSDPRMVGMATGWLRRLSSRAALLAVQYHADQDLEKLRVFWGLTARVDGRRFDCSGSPTAATSEVARGDLSMGFSRCVSTTPLCERDFRHGSIASAMAGIRTQAESRGVAQPGRALGLGPRGSPVRIRPPRFSEANSHRSDPGSSAGGSRRTSLATSCGGPTALAPYRRTRRRPSLPCWHGAACHARASSAPLA